MLKFSHRTLICFSGFIWMLAGLMLLRLGLILLYGTVQSLESSSYPLISALAPYLGSLESAAILLMSVALTVGYAKGRFVLGKSAKKGVERITSFPNPSGLGKIYSPKYYLLLGGMMGLGLSIKYLGIPDDIRGTVDIAIGIALLTGALVYFRFACPCACESS